jgi:copper chaperone
MNTYIFQVQNLKCGGCGSTITKNIKNIDGVNSINVDIEDSIIQFEGTEQNADEVKNLLDKLGYPLDSEMNSTIKKAKSYVSCMVGRMTN